jgi:hypothetical protein
LRSGHFIPNTPANTPRHGSPTTSSSPPVANKPYISFRSPRHRHDCMRIFPGLHCIYPAPRLLMPLLLPPYYHSNTSHHGPCWLSFTSLLFDVQPISTHVVGCDSIPPLSRSTSQIVYTVTLVYHGSSYTGRSQLLFIARAQGHGLAPDLAFLDDYMHGYEEFLDYST